MSQVSRSMQAVEQRTNKLANAVKGLAVATGPLLVAFAAIKAAMGFVGAIKSVNEAYDVQTAAVKRLNRALQARGPAAAAESEQLQRLAADLQALTGVGDETTIALMGTASSLGFATDRIDDAAKAAIGLSEITGKSLEQSLQDVKDAAQGNFDAFTQLNPELMFMRSNQERMAAVLDLANQGLQASSENAKSVSGSANRAAGAIGDLKEMVGAILAPIRVLLNNGVRQLAEGLQSVLAPAAQYATEVLANIGPWLERVREVVVSVINTMIGAFTFLEVVLTNLGSVWELMSATAQLAVERLKEIVKHVFTTALPEYGKWFGDNLVNLMRDAWSAVVTIIQNAGKILGDSVYEIFAFIASGGSGGVEQLMANLGTAASRSLMDGFESQLTALPEIADRKLTEKEKDLAAKIGAVGGRLGDEFAKKMSDRMVKVGGKLGDKIKSDLGTIDLQTRGTFVNQGISATQGRLITRGPQNLMVEALERMAKTMTQIRGGVNVLNETASDQLDEQQNIANNTSNTVQLVPIA
jgi:hypothetical protein